MGELISFPTRSQDEDIILVSHGKVQVALTPDGKIRVADDLDAASRALWDAVEDRVREEWGQTVIPRLQAQVRLLVKTLDSHDPQWRDHLRSSQSG